MQTTLIKKGRKEKPEERKHTHTHKSIPLPTTKMSHFSTAKSNEAGASISLSKHVSFTSTSHASATPHPHTHQRITQVFATCATESQGTHGSRLHNEGAGNSQTCSIHYKKIPAFSLSLAVFFFLLSLAAHLYAFATVLNCVFIIENDTSCFQKPREKKTLIHLYMLSEPARKEPAEQDIKVSSVNKCGVV